MFDLYGARPHKELILSVKGRGGIGHAYPSRRDDARICRRASLPWRHAPPHIDQMEAFPNKRLRPIPRGSIPTQQRFLLSGLLVFPMAGRSTVNFLMIQQVDAGH